MSEEEGSILKFNSGVAACAVGSKTQDGETESSLYAKSGRGGVGGGGNHAPGGEK